MKYFLYILFSINSAFATVDVDQVLTKCFPQVENIVVSPLKGGLSGTALYKVSADGKYYVLRVHQSEKLNPQDENEHFAMVEASVKGLAPKVVYASPDSRALIMEFVDEKTLSFADAQKPENCIRIAKAIRQAHQITGHPHPGPSLSSDANTCYNIVKNFDFVNLKDLDGALDLVKFYSTAMEKVPQVRVHGDLNPRNIFLTKNGVFFIDWAENTLADPFYDLSYFAQKLALSQENEQLLLSQLFTTSAKPARINSLRTTKKNCIKLFGRSQIAIR